MGVARAEWSADFGFADDSEKELVSFKVGKGIDLLGGGGGGGLGL
jgi:hypothetical protein